MQSLADTGLDLLSNVLIAGIGVWLLWRGVRALWRLRARPAEVALPGAELAGLGQLMPEHEHRGDGTVCETCGHAHGPTLQQAAEVRSLRDAVMVVGAIAARPCTGALFLLVLTWRLDLVWAGVVGAFVMALGTATVTVLVAIASVSLRESALLQAASGTATLGCFRLSRFWQGQSSWRSRSS